MASAGGDPLVYPRVGRLRGTVARSTTWWGRAWVRTFEETALDAGDLVEARGLARSGRLGAVVVLAGMASVAVDRGTPGEVVAQLRVTRLDDAAWEAFAAELARETGFVAALESGELPADLVEHADQAGVELLPEAADLETACPCDAWAQPCVHALALFQQLAWHLDEDPYALILLRGRTRERLLAAPPPARTAQEDAAERAAEVLRLAAGAPRGHGLADSAVAAYDEQVGRLL